MFVGIVVVAIEGVIFAEVIRIIGRSMTRWAPHGGHSSGA
jgi:sulfonate transport system permease protein